MKYLSRYLEQTPYNNGSEFCTGTCKNQVPVLTFFPLAGVWTAVTTKIKRDVCSVQFWKQDDWERLPDQYTITESCRGWQISVEPVVTHTHTYTHKHTRDVNACARASGSFHAYQLTYTPGGQVTSIHTYSGQTKISESKLTSSRVITLCHFLYP